MVNGRNELTIRINATAERFNQAISDVQKRTRALQNHLSAIARTSTIAFGAIAGIGTILVKNFADYQTALVGVGKTTDITGDALKSFGNEFRELSKRLPNSVEELLGIGQAAGQLGVRGRSNILAFTETVAKLGATTDLSADQAATELARLFEITGEGIETVGTLGSVLVELGNNFAATESEILSVASEVGKSAGVFNITSTQVLGIATALRSLGVEAQVGGSGIGRTFNAINDAIQGGGERIERLSEITGIAVDELQTQFGENSTAVFQRFVEGLGRISDEGGNVRKELRLFGLRGQQLLKVIPTLAKRSDLLGRALKSASDESMRGTALNKEFNAILDTVNVRFDILKNTARDAAIALGEELEPTVSALIEGATNIATAFTELNQEQTSFIALLIKIAGIASGVIAAISGIGFVVSKLVGGIGGLLGALGTVGGTTGLVGILGFISSPAGILALTATGIAAITAAVVGLSDVLTPASDKLQTLNNQLADLERQRKIFERTGDTAILQGLDQRISKVKDLRDEQLKVLGLEEQQGEALKEQTQLVESISQVLSAIPELTRAPRNVQREGEVDVGLPTVRQTRIPFLPEAQDDDQSARAQHERLLREQERAANARLTLEERFNQLTSSQRDFFNEQDIQRFIDKNTSLEDIRYEAGRRELAFNQNLQDLSTEQRAIFGEEEINALKSRNLTIDQLREEANNRLLEQQNEFDLILQELNITNLESLSDAEIKSLRNTIKTKEQIERQAALQRIKDKIKEHNELAAQEARHQKRLRTLEDRFGKEKVDGAKELFGQLSSLTQTESRTAFEIGKAASHANALLATAEAAINSYNVASKFGGPAAGAIAAAAAIAFGIQQQREISRIQYNPPGAQRGGIVPEGRLGLRDRIPALLEPGELIVPRPLVPDFVQSVGIPRPTDPFDRDDEGEEEETPILTIELEERAAEVITLQQREGRALGIIAS